MGIHEIKIEWFSIAAVSLATKNMKVTVSTAKCEPTIVTIAAKTALTGELTDSTVKIENVDLVTAFETTSELKTCKFQYALAWKYTGHNYNKDIRDETVISVANDGKASIELKTDATSGLVDGIHVFTISVKTLKGVDMV